MRRRRKTLEVLRPVHCGTKKVLNQPNKPVMDGMWTTLINTAPKQCMKEYISNYTIQRKLTVYVYSLH